VYSSYGTDNSLGTGSNIGGNTATRRGLDDFSGDAGFKDVGIGVGVTYNLTPSWNVDTALRYQRLLDEAADNPSTSDQGPANQLFGGVLVRYKF
jgi:outer membrane protein